MFTDKIREHKIGAHVVDLVVIFPRLTPTFVVNDLFAISHNPEHSKSRDAYPCHDAGITFMLLNQ